MDEQNPAEGERLNKYLALRLGISRREGDNYIDKKRVTINGQPVVLGARVLPGDVVEVDHKPLKDVAHTYLLFHKPVGYVSSRRSQGDAPTLYELLPKEYHSLKPVGRLDKNSSGLLILTNNGDFAYQMTHPKFYKVKIYEVQLDRPLEPLHQQMISDYGVQLEDGVSKLMIEKLVKPLDTSFSETSAALLGADGGSTANRREAVSEKDGGEKANTTMYRIIMSEGRNRQIRRTFSALGYTVTKLHRTNFGDYALGDMKPGNHKTIQIP